MCFCVGFEGVGDHWSRHFSIRRRRQMGIRDGRGAVRRKSRSLEVLRVDLERGAIVVKGSVPGKAGNVLEIAPAKVVGVNC